MRALRIEAGRGLIAQHDRSIRHQGTRDGDPLLFAATHHLRKTFCAVRHVDLFEHFPDPALGFCIRNAQQGQRKHDVLLGRERRKQVELLEDESDLIEPYTGHVARTQPGCTYPVDDHLTRRWVDDTTDE